MKTILFFILLFFVSIFTGCGKNEQTVETPPCQSASVKGVWKSTSSNDTLTFNANCTGTSSYCQSTFIYPNVDIASGMIDINVLQTNTNVGCASVGIIRCSVIQGNIRMIVDCGSGSTIYDKQ